MLELNPAKPVEVLLVAVSAGAEGIEESERGLGSELVRQRVLVKGGALLLDRSRGEGGGGADEGKGGDRLHHVGKVGSSMGSIRKLWLSRVSPVRVDFRERSPRQATIPAVGRREG